MTGASTHTGYRPDIDGLRAISIVSVVVYHAFPQLLPGGFIGVDIFFVISGYLITGIILRETADGRFSIARFYRRRVQRIFPALALVLAFCLVAGWFALLPQEYAALGKHVASGALFVPNLVFWTEAGYFDVDSMLKPLLHLWSLGVEEQFYLAWPVLLVMAARLRIPTLALTAITLAISFSLGIILIDRQATVFFLPQFRVWELLVGALLACAVNTYGRPAGNSPMTNVLSGCTGLALLIAGLVLISKERAFPGWWALLPTLGAALLIANNPDSVINRRLLGNPAMVFIGKISFPLYLWHWPLLSFARNMEGGEPSATIKIGAVTISVLLAWMSYALVEKKLRYHPGRAVPYVLTASLLALAGLGIAVAKSDGFPARTASINDIALQFAPEVEGDAGRYRCSPDHPRLPWCRSNGRTGQVVVIGDSHAGDAFYSLVRHYQDTGTGVLRLEQPNCPPLLNTSNRVGNNADKCVQANAGNIGWAAADPDIHTVYLSSMGPLYLYAPKYELEYKLAPQIDDHTEIFRRGLRDSVQTLLTAGKHVVIVIDWPALRYMPQNCFDLRPLRLTAFAARDCTLPRAQYLARNREYLETVLSLAEEFPSLRYWNTPGAFCDDTNCRGREGDRPLYRDRGHLSVHGAQYLGERHALSSAEAVRQVLLD